MVTESVVGEQNMLAEILVSSCPFYIPFQLFIISHGDFCFGNLSSASYLFSLNFLSCDSTTRKLDESWAMVSTSTPRPALIFCRAQSIQGTKNPPHGVLLISTQPNDKALREAESGYTAFQAHIQLIRSSSPLPKLIRQVVRSAVN